MKLYKIVIFFLILFVSTSLRADSISKDAKPYADSVSNFLESVYDTLPKTKNDSQIFSYFEKEIPKYFAVDYISSYSLGRYSKQLSPDLKDTYIKALLRYTALSYGSLFKNYYNLYNYKIVGADQKSNTEYIVNVLLIPVANKAKASKDKLENLDLQWRVKYSPKLEKYYIVDIIFQNISFLNSQRSDFEAKIKLSKGNLEAFVADLKQKTAM